MLSFRVNQESEGIVPVLRDIWQVHGLRGIFSGFSPRVFDFDRSYGDLPRTFDEVITQARQAEETQEIFRLHDDDNIWIWCFEMTVPRVMIMSLRSFWMTSSCAAKRPLIRQPIAVIEEHDTDDIGPSNRRTRMQSKTRKAAFLDSDTMFDQAGADAIRHQQRKAEKTRKKTSRGFDQNEDLRKGLEFVSGFYSISWSSEADVEGKLLWQLMTHLHSKKGRRALGKLLLEGVRLVSEALICGLNLNSVYFCDPKILGQLPANFDRSKCFKISGERMSAWSVMDTPPGVLGVFDKPDNDFVAELQEQKIPLILICDNIREPGNIGSVIRSFAGIGCEKILMTKGKYMEFRHFILTFRTGIQLWFCVCRASMNKLQ
ncbi:unnamed protein product [Soboliphyme baturini]|uniref:SpoU_sub_bind domain-containing protein n=1 Tax=Soboliphyme baturini TaxID=241478 RepID=A0A183J5J4_9BILA|nr:unnamed protein product [Soboliphyme baturini]